MCGSSFLCFEKNLNKTIENMEFMCYNKTDKVCSQGGGEMEIIGVMDFYTDKYTTCCITGHRKRDLPFGGDLHKSGMKRLVSMLHLSIKESYDDGFRTFISGMAEGVDLLCAKIVYEMIARGEMPEAELVCALPYREQAKELADPLDKYVYSMIFSGCSRAVVVSEREDRDRYKLRNQFMVDNSTRVIGAFKQKKGGSGTLQTINMAKRAGLELKIIKLDENPVLYIDDGDNEEF